MNDAMIARFWEDFINKSKSYGVKDSTLRWHVVHAERYIKTHPGLRLVEHTPRHVEDYLNDMGQKPQFKTSNLG